MARFWLQEGHRASWSHETWESTEANIEEVFLSSWAILDQQLPKTGAAGVFQGSLWLVFG